VIDPRFVADAAAAPAAPGAYALWLELDAPRPVAAGKARGLLPAGDYLYCGSAKGPGGLRARLARHMRREKRARWHIDQLTARAAIRGAFVFEGGDECVLCEALFALPTPLPGFGSTDCRRCLSHLRAFPPGARLPSPWENARKTAGIQRAVR
jgi:histidyl-tRNA synthetase